MSAVPNFVAKTALIFLALLSKFEPSTGLQCHHGYTCVTSHHFQECTIINNQYNVTGIPFSCPSGQFCDDSSGSVLCLDTPPPTTTELSVVEPQCTQIGKHPAANCYQYYECVSVLWYFEVQLQTCPQHHCFDIGLKECALASVVDCQSRTPWPEPEVPACTGPGLLAAPSCYQYYECQSGTSGWDAVLKSCVIGQAFDLVLIVCAPVASVDCQDRLTTTTTTVAPAVVPTCTGPGKYAAPSCYHYYECQAVSWGWEPMLKVCVVGEAFDTILVVCASVETVNCQDRLTTTTTTTTTVAPPVVPTCTGPGKHPAPSCYHYYDCESVSWGWEPVLKVCLVGEAFDTILIACASIEVVDCQSRLTTTSTTSISTSVTPPVVPTCTGPGKHPAPSCYHYYDCESMSWGWEAVLKVCVVGEAFDTILIACASIDVVDCQDRITTTSTTSMSTSATPPVVPVCTGPGKHPAPSCYHYYDCESMSWGWEAVLKVCVVGEAFDTILIACASIDVVDCQDRITTTSTTSISTSVTPPVVPTCTGPGKHPAQSCYHYYECESGSSGWEAVLKVCLVGEAFDTILIACASIDVVDCQSRLTTTCTTSMSTSVTPPVVPTCTGPGKHPAPSCYHYYECESGSSGWEAVLKVCLVGEAFDTILIACASIDVVDCQSRLTTTPPTSTTTVVPPVVVPECPGPGKHPAPSCYQYYECEAVLWWYQPVLKDCLIGEAFDTVLVVCASIATVDCQDRLTTTAVTTTVAPPIVPKCTGPGKHPAQSCYHYYECESGSSGWEAVLKVCLVGEAFDTILIACASIDVVDCHDRLTTTSTTSISTSVTPPLVPNCTGPGKHPAQSCYHYYECESGSIGWEAVLKVCLVGEAFDTILIACASIDVVDCQSRLTTTSTTSISTSVAPPVVPTCTGPGKHPAPSCYHYYECESGSSGWEAILKVCLVGEAFDTTLIACASITVVDCQSRLTTTTIQPTTPPEQCSSTTKLPASSCYHYYECEEYSWGWEQVLIACPSGEAFDVTSSTCAPISLVSCQSRLTTPSSVPEVPTCTAAGKHPAELCYQYYECIPMLLGWEAHLQTCPDGQGFDHERERCACAELVGCRAAFKAPNCTSAGRYPAPECNQYYECVSTWWWWTPELKTCPDGQGFEMSSLECVDEKKVVC